MSELDIKSMVKRKRLNLSGMDLTKIPTEEIAMYKITHLDVSNNKITSTYNVFALLPNLIKLNLSNNQIQKIDGDIGSLEKLEYLILANNKISVLPKSMSNLRKLKYLDLNNNPLNSEFKKAIGPSETKEQCHSVAAKALQYFQSDFQKIEKIPKKNETKDNKEIINSLLKCKQNGKSIKKTKGKKKQLKNTVGSVSKVSGIFRNTVPYIRNLLLIAITTILFVYGLSYYDENAYITTKRLTIWNTATSVLHPRMVAIIENHLLQVRSFVDSII